MIKAKSHTTLYYKMNRNKRMNHIFGWSVRVDFYFGN